MRFDILTIFPQIFKAPFSESILKIAQEKDLAEIHLHNLREYAPNKHRQVDDSPYGGGPGMVMKPEPFFEAIQRLFGNIEKVRKKSQIIILSPQGTLLTQKIVDAFSQEKHLILLCGHYEGIDERVSQHLATAEISIGDYVLTGGELPAMILVDAIVRKICGVLGDEKSLVEESFSRGLLEYPQYTRPAIYKGWEVPKILLNGNHQEISQWRLKKSLERTKERRPDLLKLFQSKKGEQDREK